MQLRARVEKDLSIKVQGILFKADFLRIARLISANFSSPDKMHREIMKELAISTLA